MQKNRVGNLDSPAPHIKAPHSNNMKSKFYNFVGNRDSNPDYGFYVSRILPLEDYPCEAEMNCFSASF